MTIFARLLPSPARRSPIGTRGRAFLLTLLVGAAALAALAPSAGALVISGVGSTTVGIAPRYDGGYEKAPLRPKTFANTSGNPVLHGMKEYAVFWDPTVSYHGDWEAAVESYIQRAAAQSEALSDSFAADSGYTDKSNRPAGSEQTFMGAYSDYRPYPSAGDCTDPQPFEVGDRIGLESGGPATAVCLTSAEMAEALKAFIAEQHLPTGLGYSYFLLTPPGVTVCLDGGTETGYCSDYKKSSLVSYENSFCSYHSDINPGGLPTGDGNTIVYAVIPWTAGGYGDWGLAASDERPGWECQDGGWYEGPKGLEREHAKERTKQEQEAFEKTMNAEEKAKLLLQEELEGPHEEEPNQQACTTEDGYCDYGLADLIVNQISLQQQDMVTDPLLNAWKDNNEYEVSDECRFAFGPYSGGNVTASEQTRAGTLSNQSLAGTSYYLSDTYWPGFGLQFPDGKNGACWHGIALAPNFTAPSPVNSGETVGFDGMGSDITLDAGVRYSAGGSPEPTYATYAWNFGDGTPTVSGYAPGSPECANPWLSPCAASVLHSYQYGGNYKVTLTVKDVGGNTTTIEHEIVVDGPHAPSPAGAAAGSASTGSASGAGSSAPAASGATLTPSPVAAAAVLSRTLKNALHSGLVVRYSVNEQVAGHFEVLLSRTIAKRLGISGAPAVGLPAGTAPQVVIAKALLVTTAGGRSSIKIQFSRRTAARLARLHKVSLMLRLIVRNAALHDPATTTVLSSVTLD